MVDLTKVSSLIGVLQVLCGRDPRQVQKVEKSLKSFLKNVNCVSPLMEVLCGGSDDAVRQEAGILLKKKIATFAPKLTTQQQKAMKNRLVERLFAENSMAVANTIAGIIATATVSLQWPELASVLEQLIKDPNEKHRILALTLVSELSGVAFYLPTKLISEVLVAGCEDSVDSVAKAAAAGVINCIRALQVVKQGVMDFSPVVPPFLRVLHRCLANEEDNAVILGFQHLRMTFFFPEPLINDHFEALTELIFTILLDPHQDSYEPVVKQEAQSTFIHLIRVLSKQFAQKELVRPTLLRLMNRISEEKGCVIKNENEDPVNDVLQPCRILIGAMAAEIPAKYFAHIAFQMAEEALSSSDNVGMRKAGFTVIGIIVLGLSTEARERIKITLPLLLEGLSDGDLHTREAATFAVRQYAYHCNPEICFFCETIIPAMVKGLNSNEVVVQRHCCDTIEDLSTNLRKDALVPFLSSLVHSIGQLAQSNSPYLQEGALRALTAVAATTGTEFQSYTDETMTFLEPLLMMDCGSEADNCSGALSCLGNIAVAIGKDQFQSCHYELGMKAVMEFLKSGKSEFMESALIYIANMSELMGKDFESSMKDIMPFIFEALNESELIIPQNEDNNDEEMNGHDEDEDEEEEDEHDDVSEAKEVTILVQGSESFINKKLSAITAIGYLARHTKSCFLPFLHQTITTFTSEDARVLYSFHVDIRAKAISVLPDFIVVMTDATNLPFPTKNERLTLSQDVQDVAELLLQQCFSRLDYDNEKKVVSTTVLSLGDIIDRLGASVLDICNKDKGGKYLILLSQTILTYLNENSPCQMTKNLQNNNNNEEEEGDEENDIHLLMENIGKLIGILAKVLPSDEFIISFDQFHSKLLKFTKPSRSQADRSMAIDCYAGVFENIGLLSMKYADSILPVLKSALEDQDSLHETRRAAAYCLGVLIEAGGKELVPRYLQFLQWLHPVCVREEEVSVSDVDNAVAAVARMIVVAPEGLPLSQVLPVMFSALPLRQDFAESTVVFKAFLLLIESNDPTTLGMVEDLVPLLVGNFEPNSLVPDETRDLAGRAISLLAGNSTCRDAVYSYLSSLTDSEHIEKLESGLSAYGMVWNGK